MAANQSDGANRPFKDLDRLLKNSGMQLTQTSPHPSGKKTDKQLSPRQEARLFAKAMAEVQPLKSNHHWRPPRKKSARPSSRNDDEQKKLLTSPHFILKIPRFWVTKSL
jgi:hypothetical protein